MRALLIAALAFSAAAVLAEAPAYSRGDEVHVLSPDGSVASPAVQQIVAVPGDRFRIHEGSAFVDDGPLTELSPELVASCGQWDQTVPEGHYVVLGEAITETTASRSCSLLPAGRISLLKR